MKKITMPDISTWMGGAWKIGKEAVIFIDDSVTDPNEIVSTIIHESVHVWQGMCEYIVEEEPSREMEAYCIEYIAITLIKEYSRLAAKRELDAYQGTLGQDAGRGEAEIQSCDQEASTGQS